MAHSPRLGRLVGSKFVQRVCLWVLPSLSLPTCNSESEGYAGGDCNSISPARVGTPASAFQSHMRHSILYGSMKGLCRPAWRPKIVLVYDHNRTCSHLGTSRSCRTMGQRSYPTWPSFSRSPHCAWLPQYQHCITDRTMYHSHFPWRPTYASRYLSSEPLDLLESFRSSIVSFSSYVCVHVLTLDVLLDL